MSAKALAVFSTNAGTVAASLLAGTTTETSGSLDPVIGGCPMCASSHLAKLGVTRTTPIRAPSAQIAPDVGLQESGEPADTVGTDALRSHEPRRVVATFTGGRCWTGCGCACFAFCGGCPVAEQSGRSGKL